METREPRRQYCGDKCKWRSQKAEQKKQGSAGTDLALLERSDLAVAAVRAGADPLGALGLVIDPPEDRTRGRFTSSESAARRLLCSDLSEARSPSQRGRLFEVDWHLSCGKPMSRLMNGHREFRNSTLMRELFIPSVLDVERERRVCGDLDHLMKAAV